MNSTLPNKICPRCGDPLPTETAQGLCPRCVLLDAVAATATGIPVEPTTSPALADVQAALPQLEIQALIGRGAMGTVYRARQPKLDRLVAVKVLRPSPSAGEEFTQRFRREAQVLARLNHPGIVAVYDYGEAGGFYYLLMEFVQGVNMRQALRSGGFTPQQAMALVPKICEALQYAHDEGVLHRDIKPENVLIDTRGRVKMADFGIARLLDKDQSQDATLTGTGHLLGTPNYMAPEQVERPHDVDQRADIYSLGVIFYEMLTGELPLGRFAPPSAKSNVDSRVDGVVLQALAKERELRQSTATVVREQVETIVATPGMPAQAARTKTAPCHISTPEHLRTFKGRFFNIMQGHGELRLDPTALSFKSGWHSTTIPLTDIRKLSRGCFPASAKPVPLNYFSVEYVQAGVSHTLIFLPYQLPRVMPGQMRQVVAEWLDALQTALHAATGKSLPVVQIPTAGLISWGEVLKGCLMATLMCLPIYLVIPPLVERRWPNRWSDFIAAPITAASLFVMLAGLRWLGKYGQARAKDAALQTVAEPAPTGAALRQEMPSQTPASGGTDAGEPHQRVKCYGSTPWRMRHSFPAPAAHIFHCAGELCLEKDHLVFMDPWRRDVTVPWAAIRHVDIGQFQMWTTPWVMKYARFHFLLFEFEVAGRRQKLCLLPVASQTQPGQPPATLEKEWYAAITHAIQTHTGRTAEANDLARVTYSAEPSWNRKGIPLFLLGGAGAVACLVGLHGNLPAVYAASMLFTMLFWGSAVWFSIGFLRANAALQRGDFDAVTADECLRFDDPAQTPFTNSEQNT